MGPPSKLSVIWFPEKQRNTATAISAVSNTFGNCIAFLLGPLLVTKASDVPKLLYTDLALATIPTICILFYFPYSPSKVTTIAAINALLSIPVKDIKSKENIAASNINEDPLVNDKYLDDAIKEDSEKVSLQQHLSHFGHELWECATNYSTIITVIVYGMLF